MAHVDDDSILAKLATEDTDMIGADESAKESGCAQGGDRVTEWRTDCHHCRLKDVVRKISIYRSFADRLQHRRCGSYWHLCHPRER